MKIGLSLRGCIKDMIDGKVDPRDVAVIITNCTMATKKDYDFVRGAYSRTAWRAKPELAGAVMDQLHAAGRIISPRETNHSYTHRSATNTNGESESWIEVFSLSKPSMFMACVPCLSEALAVTGEAA